MTNIIDRFIVDNDENIQLIIDNFYNECQRENIIINDDLLCELYSSLSDSIQYKLNQE